MVRHSIAQAAQAAPGLTAAERQAQGEAAAGPPGTSGPAGRFTEGSILRHTLIMTATGSIGIIALFFVDFLSLLYVSWLGRTELKAAVGFASQVLFFPVSINIGLTIAVSATVARALGARQRAEARSLAASSLALAAVVSSLIALLALSLVRPLLEGLGAHGATLDTAQAYLWITLPGNVPLALGMALSGVLRGIGDARRAMYVTLAGGLLTAVIDPILIFGCGLGVEGAAISTLLSRFTFLVVGLDGAVRVHDMVARPRLATILADLPPILTIALPAILTNLATPIGNAYALRIYAQFGDAAVAAGAIIDRIVPLAFGVIFALTGAVGPILGQNFGARRLDRVAEALTACFTITAAYTLSVWALLALGWPMIAALFEANPETATYLGFFCRFGVSAWLFLGCLFVANAAFNNLGFPVLSMLFNWGRATLGTMPFVALGASLGGVQGGQLGMAAGAGIFGTAALVTAYYTVGRLGRPR